MITQDQIRKKAIVPWNSGAYLSACVHGQTIFPLEIRFRTPGSKEMLDEFTLVRDWIQILERSSRNAQQHGYEIVWKTVSHRTLGSQRIPQRIFFAGPEDWLGYIDKEKEARLFGNLIRYTRTTLPELLPYLAEKPHKALANAESWEQLITVCRWFRKNPKPQRYIRQLDIVGIDTKFIETQKAVLIDLLPLVLKSDDYQTEITTLAGHGFERKFGLAFDPPLIRLRLLDPALVRHGLSDLTIPLSQLAEHDFGARRIFITENKINGLSFPEVTRSLVIFGLGYGVEMLQVVSWLKDKEIVYWGDIDTHGFAILSQLRGYFPQIVSILMDRKTLLDHQEMWVTEPAEKIFTGELPHLTAEEDILFRELKQNTLGPHVRLEQERIRFSALTARLV
jgi:hypothetical protein